MKHPCPWRRFPASSVLDHDLHQNSSSPMVSFAIFVQASAVAVAVAFDADVVFALVAEVVAIVHSGFVVAGSSAVADATVLRWPPVVAASVAFSVNDASFVLRKPSESFPLQL